MFFCVVFSRFTSQLSLVIGFSSPTSAIHVLSGLTNHQAMHETTQYSWNCSTFCHATMKFPKATKLSHLLLLQQINRMGCHFHTINGRTPWDPGIPGQVAAAPVSIVCHDCCQVCQSSCTSNMLPKRFFSIHPYQSIRIIQLHGPPVGNGQVSPKDLLRGQVDETVHIYTPQIQLSEAGTEHRVFCLSDY